MLTEQMKKEKKKRTVILVADPNMKMSTSIFPNDLINVILLDNQIIKGMLEFGKQRPTQKINHQGIPCRIKREANS